MRSGASEAVAPSAIHTEDHTATGAPRRHPHGDVPNTSGLYVEPSTQTARRSHQGRHTHRTLNMKGAKELLA